MIEQNTSQLEKFIYIIRGQRVMLDSDLADLYEIETKALIQAVSRNKERFPTDFLIHCDSSDLNDLRSQFVTANRANDWNHKRRSTLHLFTECGIAMLSSVLKSDRAIQVNISIMRVFVKLRSFLSLEVSSSDKVEKLEAKTNQLFKIVFERMDSIEDLVEKKAPMRRKRIGHSLK